MLKELVRALFSFDFTSEEGLFQILQSIMIIIIIMMIIQIEYVIKSLLSCTVLY